MLKLACASVIGPLTVLSLTTPCLMPSPVGVSTELSSGEAVLCMLYRLVLKLFLTNNYQYI